MTKVEKLRDRAAQLRAELFFAIQRGDAALVTTGSNIRIAADVDEVLDAFLARGRAEEWERICNVGYELTKGEPAVGVSSLWEIMNGEGTVVVAREDCYVIPASVLASPDKVNGWLTPSLNGKCRQESEYIIPVSDKKGGNPIV